MKINYKKILNKNMLNVFKDVLLIAEENGLQEGHHLYVTFDTNNSKVKIPHWLKEKYQSEMTIIIQYEYWDFKIKKDFFNICLSFDDIKANLEISFDSIMSFADPYANFGLQLKPKTIDTKNVESKKILKNKNDKGSNKKDNVINFNNYKKN